MDILLLVVHPVRWRIVEILASGEHTAGQITADLTHRQRIGREAVSKHLTKLTRAGLITVRPDENFRIYRLSPRVIGALAGLVEHLMTLRDATEYDDIELDGSERDIGYERDPHWRESDPDHCWCIRKTLNLV
ncbi:ArsR/SmtB family transcription factor [Microcella alkaliphila]|uniref:ArsR/SmtB family transcription factor n=1 Tax=Microcella alkaliphila TaxID=279828 RepID=UPI0013747DEE|nr:metalloregulator ArsR/SmtB family transcription factor [Microcella alkaliphila]